MPIYNFRFETVTEFRYPVSRHFFMLRCMPKECMCQHIIDSHFSVTDNTWLSEGSDVFGNHVIYGSCIPPHKSIAIISEGTLQLRHYAMYDESRPCFDSPSPLTRTDGDMRAFMHKVLEGSERKSVTERAKVLSHAVNRYLEYQNGVTDSHTTAAEAFKIKAGVCQDYSHILIALCREAGITARYVSGFVPGEGASHAWVEVYDQSRWSGIDPTNDCMADNGYIIIAHGRDADDCPLNRGIYTGLTDELMTIRVRVDAAKVTQ